MALSWTQWLLRLPFLLWDSHHRPGQGPDRRSEHRASPIHLTPGPARSCPQDHPTRWPGGAGCPGSQCLRHRRVTGPRVTAVRLSHWSLRLLRPQVPLRDRKSRPHPRPRPEEDGSACQCAHRAGLQRPPLPPRPDGTAAAEEGPGAMPTLRGGPGAPPAPCGGWETCLLLLSLPPEDSFPTDFFFFLEGGRERRQNSGGLPPTPCPGPGIEPATRYTPLAINQTFNVRADALTTEPTNQESILFLKPGVALCNQEPAVTGPSRQQ